MSRFLNIDEAVKELMMEVGERTGKSPRMWTELRL